MTTSTKKPYLDHAAYESLLRRAAEYEDKDWDRAERFERHAIHAALDLRDARAEKESAEQTAQVNDYLADKWRRFALGIGGDPTAVSPEDLSRRLLRMVMPGSWTWAFEQIYADRKVALPAHGDNAYICRRLNEATGDYTLRFIRVNRTDMRWKADYDDLVATDWKLYEGEV